MTSAQSPTSYPANKLILFSAGMVAFLYWAAQYIFVPVLPLAVQARTTSLELTGLALSIYGLGHLVIRIPAGIMAGWFGRNKPFVIAGLLMLACGSAVMVTSSNIGLLIVGRGITGIAAGTWVPLVLLFNNSFPVHDQVRATGMVSFISALARLSATALTPLLVEKSSILIPFWVSVGFALLAALILLPRSEKKIAPSIFSFSAYRILISKREVLFPSLLALLTQHVNWALTFGFIPTLARNLGAGFFPGQPTGSPVFCLFCLRQSLDRSTGEEDGGF